MAEINWVPQALDDIETIADFIAHDSPHYAQLFATKVFDSVERLQVFPESGRIVPEMNQENIREIILGNYRIIFSILEDTVLILRIGHRKNVYR